MDAARDILSNYSTSENFTKTMNTKRYEINVKYNTSYYIENIVITSTIERELNLFIIC